MSKLEGLVRVVSCTRPEEDSEDSDQGPWYDSSASFANIFIYIIEVPQKS